MIYEWVVYGLDIEPDEIIIKMDGNDIEDSRRKTSEFLRKYEIDFDTFEPYDDVYKNRVNKIKQ
jgi:hypothetical protein